MRNAGNQDIYVMNAEGTNPTRLTNHSASDFRPTWSPDGTKIITLLGIGSGFVSSKLNGANAVTIFTAPAGFFSVSEPKDTVIVKFY